MRHLLISVAPLLAVLLVLTSAKTYYVKPTASTPCPEIEEGVPCFTLSQYATQPNNYFASNSTLILLPGNHSLDLEFGIRNITNLSITRNTTIAHSDSDMVITCSQSARFTLEDIDAVSMRGLVLIGCMNNNITSVYHFTLEDCTLQGQGYNGTGLELNWVTSTNITRSSFYSYTGKIIWYSPVSLRVGGAIIMNNSIITISSSTFTNNTVQKAGGAVYAESSNITIHNTTFNNNTVIGDDGRGGVQIHGAAVYVTYYSSFTLYNTTFNNNTVIGYFASGAVFASFSNITIYTTTFNSNSVTATGQQGGGGAVVAVSSYITVHNTIFNRNSATAGYGTMGGAVLAQLSDITFYNTTFNNNTATLGGAMYAFGSNITLQITTFNGNSATGAKNGIGGALFANSSKITIHNTTFNNNTATGELTSGAVVVELSNVTIHSTTFNNNTVTGILATGGAMYVVFTNITINTTIFNNNTVTGVLEASGGAVTAQSSNITILNSTLTNNAINVTGVVGYGGALGAVSSNITIQNTTFNSNTATGQLASGGGLGAEQSNITINTTIFNNNTVSRGNGGGVFLTKTTLNSVKFLVIKNNMATTAGALYAIEGTMYFSGNTTVSNNYGSLYCYSCNVTFTGYINIMNNSYATNKSEEGGAITAFQSEIVFTGTANVTYNKAIRGGAISATQSKIYVYGDITIAYNTASLSGGGIYAYQSEINLENSINVSNNSALECGGGIHIINSITRMTDHSKTYFVGNHAKRGGGGCLELNAKLYIVKKQNEDTHPDTWIRLEFTQNFAVYGGALYIADDTNSGTCQAIPFSGESTVSRECFIQGLLSSTKVNKFSILESNICNTYFTNNSASKVGDTIYGGLLDRCTVNPDAEIFTIKAFNYDRHNVTFTTSSLTAVSYLLYITNLSIQDFNDSPKIISSGPVRVCFCRENRPDCSYHPQPVKVRKGETFTVSLVAVDQVNNTKTDSKVLSYLSAEAGVVEGQSNQTTGEGCTELNYTVTSPHTSEKLHLYANGSCKDIGISLQTVEIYFTACPIGFKDTGSKCDCDPELTQYISNCSIDTQSVLRRGNVWIAFVNTSANKSVVTYPHCPFDYCYPSTKHVRIKVNMPNDADKQCAFNRSGKLCGSCKNNLTLSLGSSRCMPCSNHWSALITVFAIAGVALVAFILVCNLTVAAGTVNGLLFYANIVSSNKAIFFSDSTNRFLTIFVAWLNLDFGFETCFFNGLNGYSKTWLQLVFPTYVIFLVVLIIKVCEYSSKFARYMRLIARNNPVATLDTLVLLSYTKFLSTIISAWQFATLKYSDGTREIVWLVDGNIKYFELKHIPLFVAALVIFVLALTYTLLMLLWQWLLLCPNRKPFVWIRNSKLHGIMDAYFIAFNKNHRYWTGLLLLARVLLYLVSALNGTNSTDPRMNLLAVSCVVGSLILWKELTRGRIYRKWTLNVLDSSFLFNLLVLAIVTFYVIDVGGNQTAVANISVSITFITFILIISYHAYAFILHNQIEKIKTKIFNKYRGTFPRSQQILNAGSSDENSDNDVAVPESVVIVPQIPVDSEGNPILDGFDTNEEDNFSCSTSDSNHPETKSKEDETKSQQQELEDFIGDLRSGTNNNYLQEVKGEESYASDYDELAPLLQLNTKK